MDLQNHHLLKIVSSKANYWIDSEQNVIISFDISRSLSHYDQTPESSKQGNMYRPQALLRPQWLTAAQTAAVPFIASIDERRKWTILNYKFDPLHVTELQVLRQHYGSTELEEMNAWSDKSLDFFIFCNSKGEYGAIDHESVDDGRLSLARFWHIWFYNFATISFIHLKDCGMNSVLFP
jgi:hypothetical protein